MTSSSGIEKRTASAQKQLALDLGDASHAPTAVRRTIALLCLATFVDGVDTLLLSSSFLALQHDLDLSTSALSVLACGQALSQALSSPFWGYLADGGVSRRVLLATGMAAWGAFTLALSWTTGFAAIFALRLLNGIALGMLSPVAQALIPEIVPEAARGRVFGMVFCSMGLGKTLSSSCVSAMADQQIWGFDGWRVAFALVGTVSLLLALLVLLTMEERSSSTSPVLAGIRGELRKLRLYMGITTFKLIVLQGLFGCFPWAALGFATMFLQLAGLKPYQVSLIVGAQNLSNALGCLLGGGVGDLLEARSAAHGRPLTAQVSVLSGIILSFILFRCVSPSPSSWPVYLALMCGIGLLASWCYTGVNAPILARLVGPEHRATVMAWTIALDSSVGSFGNVGVGFLAEKVFGYVAVGEVGVLGGQQAQNVTALASSLVCCTVVPWIVCFVLYSFLHFSHRADVLCFSEGALVTEPLQAVVVKC